MTPSGSGCMTSDPRELCFQFNKRILAYFCVDHTEVWMTTKLAGKNTYFLPFNQAPTEPETTAARAIRQTQTVTRQRICGRMSFRRTV